MSTNKSTDPFADSKKNLIVFGVVIALLGHTAWGLYPVLSRYLQTVSLLPTFAMAGVGNAVVLLILILTSLRRMEYRHFRTPIMWFFALAVVGRSVTNVLAPRYTLATYAQLINLLSPFFVVFLSMTLFKDRVPKNTVLALSLTIIGAVMMLGSDFSDQGMTFNLTQDDWTGIGLALVSSVFWALYMIFTRRSLQANLPGDAILMTQMLSLVVVYFTISFLVGENWTRWMEISPLDWGVFAGFTLVVLYGANSLNVLALKYISAPLLSSMMSWRLISTLGGGYLLLGEKLSSAWQYAGAVIVLTTLSWYLWQQQTTKPTNPQ